MPLTGSAAPSDGSLAQAVASGGPGARDAEAELCRRFAPRVRAYGRRHLRDDDAAADLVQRVLLRVIEKLRAGEVREPQRIASFILGTARLTCHELRRVGAREAPLELDSPARLELTDTPATVDRPKLARALEELTERERTVLVETFFREQSSAEIARALRIGEGNVRVIRHRALARLRSQLGENE